MACLQQELIGCIAGVRYSQAYGFIGLFFLSACLLLFPSTAAAVMACNSGAMPWNTWRM